MNTGTKVYRNYFGIKFGTQLDCQYGRLYPVFRKMMYPGDVFKVHADLLIRYQPMLAPPMNDAVATTRFFFVSLRLVEPNIELIITGSNDGKLSSETLPVCDSVFKNLTISTNHVVEKHSLLDILYGIPVGLDMVDATMLAKLNASKASPAGYFAKAYYRCIWDYYRDENLYTSFSDYADFENAFMKTLHRDSPSNSVGALGAFNVNLKKDRITSALPWQLKAVAAPTIEITGTGTLSPNYTNDFFYGVGNSSTDYPIPSDPNYGEDDTTYANNGFNFGLAPFALQQGLNESDEDFASRLGIANTRMKGSLNQPMSVTPIMTGFNGAQFREMMAQTRIFERLARCGSRYTEYLHANFGVAPSDGTLQRAQYLGGFKTRIVTTEVVQTAADGSNPVGTLRGHGITHGTSTIKPFMAREPGIMIGLMDVKPEVIYAQGVDRELTYRSRYDFLNPSFQHLSEQEVRKGEVYFGTDTDSYGNLINDQTWGFQPYAEELRRGIKHVVGDMRDSLSFWNQSLIMSSRPSLNAAFINATNHRASFNRPFAVNSADAYPLVVDFGGIIEAYRPLVKNGTPGLVDHN